MLCCRNVILLFLCFGPVSSGLTVVANTDNKQNICAAVLVPGFLTGSEEFKPLCQALTERGLPTVAVPMPNWHWLPCLGGRSARPLLERIDFTVKHLIANDGDISSLPNYEYSMADCLGDFRANPGGILKVGGSFRVDEYPVVEPRGRFPLPPEHESRKGKVALIGHSAGGWISRVYLSSRSYGGKAYSGSQHVHSLVTLGTPHAAAQGPIFEGVRWVNEEVAPVRTLCVAGTGFVGGEWGGTTKDSYAFCCPHGSDGTSHDGDGLTPVFSSLAMEGVEKLILEDTGHFPWSDVIGGELLAPDLARDHKERQRWYGSEGIVDKWLDWILRGIEVTA